jgi:ABC-type nickel/cobalt efflux system permease component RcnA
MTMKLQQIKTVLAAVWVFAVIVVFIGSAHATSTSDRLLLVAFALLPPVAMWLWWQDPSQTLSESIHGVRDEKPATKPPAATD